MHESDPTDCGCAPTEREWRSFGGPVSRRGAIGLGVIGVLGFGALGAGIALPALAIEGYPSWEDVEAARNNESAKASEITKIENLIQQLANDVAAKQAEAERLASEYLLAQEAFEDAAMRADQLQQQADEQAALASDTATKLGNLAAAQYREGGDNTSSPFSSRARRRQRMSSSTVWARSTRSSPPTSACTTTLSRRETTRRTSATRPLSPAMSATSSSRKPSRR